jgi:hypothetical protein
MKHEVELKLQAYLDGELPDRERAEVEALVAKDADAKALFAELENTAKALSGHEAGTKLPESRDFFWSKIQREIGRQESTAAGRPVAKVPLMTWLMHRLAPVGAIALLAAVAVLWLEQPKSPSVYGELELASDSMGAITYRNQEERLTLVWFYDRKADSQFTPAPVFASMDAR